MGLSKRAKNILGISTFSILLGMLVGAITTTLVLTSVIAVPAVLTGLFLAALGPIGIAIISGLIIAAVVGLAAFAIGSAVEVYIERNNNKTIGGVFGNIVRSLADFSIGSKLGLVLGRRVIPNMGSGLVSPPSIGFESEATTPMPKTSLKFVIIGAQNVGKYALMRRYGGDLVVGFIKSPVYADFHTKIVNIESENRMLPVHVWYISGKEAFRDGVIHYFKEADGAMLVFDLTDAKTFDALIADNSLRAEFQTMCPGASFVLIGNKSDLLETLDPEKQKKSWGTW